MGYGDGVKGYKLWDLEVKKIMVIHDVVFDEDHMLKAIPIKLKTHNFDDTRVEDMPWVEVEKMRNPPNSIVEGEGTTNEVSNSESIATRQGKQVTRPYTHLEDYVTFILFAGNGKLTSFKEAISCLEKEKWLQAMYEERASLDNNQT